MASGNVYSFIGPVGHNMWWENSQNRSFGPKNGPKLQKIRSLRYLYTSAAFLCISLNFSVFLYISLNFSTFFLNFSAFLVSGLKDPNVLYYRKAWDSRIQGDHDQLYLMIRYLSVSHPVLNMTFTCHMACPPIQLVPPFNWSSHWTWARWI